MYAVPDGDAILLDEDFMQGTRDIFTAMGELGSCLQESSITADPYQIEYWLFVRNHEFRVAQWDLLSLKYPPLLVGPDEQV